MSNLSLSARLLLALAGSLALAGTAIAQEAPQDIKPEKKAAKEAVVDASIYQKIASLTAELQSPSLTAESRKKVETQLANLRAMLPAGAEVPVAPSEGKSITADGGSGGTASASTGTPAPVHPENAPLKFDATLHDFGKISDEAPVSYSFKVVNRGEKIVNITGVKASCGCTASAASKMKLEPNDETTIDIRFDPSGRNGPEVKTVTVTTDDPQFPTYQLMSTSIVNKTVLIEPVSVNFGAVPPRTVASQEVSITCKIEGFNIKKAELTGVQAPNMTLEEVGKDTVQLDGVPATRYRYKISTNDKMPIGPLSAALSIDTNLVSPKFARQNIGIGGEIAGGVSISPQIVYLRMSQAGEAIVGESQLISRTNQPFRILTAQLVNTPPGLNAVIDIKPREKNNWAAQRVIVSATAPNSAAEIRGEVVLKTDVKDMEEIRMQIVGWQQSPPQPAQPTPVAAPKASAVPVPMPISPEKAAKSKE
jgi:hypothetical protein